MNVETLRDLQARCKAAPGPDRELDWAIADEFATEPFDSPYPFTGSNDEALAFVERVLPGRGWCCLHRALRSKAIYNSDLSRLPLETISAALRLLIAKEERG